MGGWSARGSSFFSCGESRMFAQLPLYYIPLAARPDCRSGQRNLLLILRACGYSIFIFLRTLAFTHPITLTFPFTLTSTLTPSEPRTSFVLVSFFHLTLLLQYLTCRSLNMLGLRAKCVVADNSGALIATVIDIMGRPAKALGRIGDEVTVVVERAKPIAVLPKDSPAHVVNAQTQKVRRGDVKRAVIVRTRSPIQRPDGRSIRFDDNACVLLNQKGDMIGTRVTGIVAAELRKSGRWGKVMSLSPKVI